MEMGLNNAYGFQTLRFQRAAKSVHIFLFWPYLGEIIYFRFLRWKTTFNSDSWIKTIPKWKKNQGSGDIVVQHNHKLKFSKDGVNWDMTPHNDSAQISMKPLNGLTLRLMLCWCELD